MVSLPHLDARAAVSTGRRLAPPGPDLSDAEVTELVAGLRAAAEASVGHVAAVTHLSTPASGSARIIDRSTWVAENVAMAWTMLAQASGGELPRPVLLRDKVAGRANGAQLGAALALLSTRVLGQYLPFTEQPSLVLVAPNVAKAERDLGVDRDDFRLWVCLHEQTHRLQFAQAPWLREHLLTQVGRLLADDDAPAPGVRSTTRSLVDVVVTPAQRVVFDEVSAVMALLEGYADDMMDRVGPDVVPSVVAIRAAFEGRRNRGGLAAVANRLLGMDLPLAQYRDGARFCRAVIDRVGIDGLNAVYAGPSHLPTPDEIRTPQAWVSRVHG